MNVPTRRTWIAAVALLVTVALTAPVAAQTYTWTGTGTLSSLWSDSGNWSPGLPPSSSNTALVFGASPATALTNDIGSGPLTINQIDFTAAAVAYVIGGNALNFGASPGVIGFGNSAAVTINNNLGVSNGLLATGTGAGSIALNGAISGSGGLTVNCAGTVILGSSSNNYAGGTLVSSGTLALTANSALPTNSVVSIASAGVLDLGNSSNTAATAASQITLNGGLLRASGTGMANYYLNKLVMTGGSLDFSGATNFGLHFVNSGASVTINAGNSSWVGGTSGIQTDQPLTINVAAGAGLSIGCMLSPGGANSNFTVTGNGSVNLSNMGNTANITASHGTLIVNDLSTDLGTGPFGALGTGQFAISSGALVYTGPTATCAKPITLSTYGNIFVQPALAPATNLTLSGVIGESAAGAQLIFSGFGLNARPNTLTLTANNTYTGATTVEGPGILAITTIANGGGASPIGAASNAAAKLMLGLPNNGRGTLLYTGTDAAPSTNRGATVGGLYANGDGGAIGVQNTGTNLTWGGQITGSGSFIKTGDGTLKLTNTTNNYTGGTYVEAGTLAIGATGNVLPPGQPVTVQAGAVLDYGPYTNSSALGTLKLFGGTLRATGATSSDISVAGLTMTGGSIDFTGLPFTWLHIDSTAGITIDAPSTTATWIGSGNCQMFNDAGNMALPIYVAAGTAPSGIDLDAGLILASRSASASFDFASIFGLPAGTARLTNTQNTANFRVSGPTLRVDDLAALGSGSVTIDGGTLAYGGPTASTNRTFGMSGDYLGIGGATFSVLQAGTNLTLTAPLTGGTGGVTKTGPGTLTLAGANTYTGGTTVAAGTLAIGANGAVLLGGSNVTVQSGATLSLGNFHNSSATALGTVTLNSGTLAVPTGANDYYLNQLVMTNGAVDFTGSTDFHLHFVNANAHVFIATGNSTWIGSGTSRIQNDTNGPLDIEFAYNVVLNLGVILSNAGSNPTFTFSGEGSVRLANVGNTANISSVVTVLSNDLSTNIGFGAYGTLGAGTFSLAGAMLRYDGPTAASDKPLTLTTGGGYIEVANIGTNLTMNGRISESAGSQGLAVFGPPGIGFSTLTLTANNTFSGPVTARAQVILAIPAIGIVGSGGSLSPLGQSSNAPANLTLGFDGSYGRGDLLYTGAGDTATDRGATVFGLYVYGGGGAIGVQNAATTLTWTGPIVQPNGSPSSFVKTGAGTLFLTNTANTYTGGTYVEAGTLALAAASVVPAGTDVTVFAGGVLDLGLSNSPATTLGVISLIGGTWQHTGPSYGYYLKNLSLTGGTVADAPSGGETYIYLGDSIGISSNSSATTSVVAFSDPFSGFINNSSWPIAIQVAGGSTSSGVDLDLNAVLYGIFGGNPTFVKTGSGVLRLNNSNPAIFQTADIVVSQGKLRVDALAALGNGAFSLTGGTFQYGGPSDMLTKPITLDLGVSGIEVMQPGTTLTLTAPLTGGGGLAIRGAGTLTLPAGSTYAGGTTIDGTTVAVTDDTQFGAPSGGISVVNGGLLQYAAGSSTSRTYTLDSGGTVAVAAGQTLTIAGGRVNGGFLAGPGTFVVTGGTALNGATTFASTPISVTGAASFTNFSNGSPLTVAAGMTAPVIMTRLINQGSGTITIGAASAVNAADFQSYGTLTLNPAVVGSNQQTLLTNTGTSAMFFNGGSRTFIGTPQTANSGGQPTFVAGMDLEGKNLVIAGGLFVNNGFVSDFSNGPSGSIIVDYGALYKGAGFTGVPVITQNGGKVQAGNSPGAASFGNFVFGPGGVNNYVFAIDDATGTAGPRPDAAGHVSGWGLINAIQRSVGSATTTGDFLWTATPADKLTIAIDTLINPTTVGTDIAGPMADFDPSKAYSWPAAQWAGNYSGPTTAAALDAATTFDTTEFANPIQGEFGWSLDSMDRSLSLTYAPSAVPEPGTLALLLTAILPPMIQRGLNRRGSRALRNCRQSQAV